MSEFQAWLISVSIFLILTVISLRLKEITELLEIANALHH
jgi:hypothetical protein